MAIHDLAPLRGVRVLSLAQQLPGPYAGMLLGELGAELVLVEQITDGDPARRIPPFFEAVNRGKKSIAVDLKSADGLEVLRRLVGTARVILEGFRPGVAKRLGVDFESLLPVRGDLIYCSISGYGQDSDARLVPGHDVSYQARGAGIDVSTADPVPGGYPVADLSAAMYAALAVTAALHTPDPVYLDLSLTEAALSWRLPQLADAWANGHSTARGGSNPAYGLFRASDGWISLSVMHEDHFWEPLCRALDMVDAAGLSREERTVRAADLRARIAEQVGHRPSRELLAELTAAGVPAGVVNTADSVRIDPMFRQRGMIRGEPGQEVLRTPLSRTAPEPAVPAPQLGEHTTDLLADIGLSNEETAGLLERGSVMQSALH